MSDPQLVDDQLDAIWQAIRGLRSQRSLDERQSMLERLGAGAPSSRVSDAGMEYPGVGLNPGASYQGNAQPFIGQANVLLDPTFEGSVGGTITTTPTAFGMWSAHYVLNSGAAPAPTFSFAARGTPNSDPFSSGLLQFAMNTVGAADFNIYVYPTTPFHPNYVNTLDFLVASLRHHSPFGFADDTHYTTIEATVELYNGTSTTVVGSATFDLLNAAAPSLISTAYTTSNSVFRGADWYWRLKLHLVAIDAFGFFRSHRFGEPQMHFAYTPDPVPYQPAIANWLVGGMKSGDAAGGDLAGTYPNPTVAKASNSFALPNDESITLSSDTNDQAIASTSAVVRFTASGALRNLTGMTGGADGRLVYLENVGSNDVVLKHDVTSTAANRFYCPNNAEFTLKQNAAVVVVYDATSSRWRVMQVPAGTSVTVGGTPVNTTPGAISAGGGSGTAADLLHAHQSPGGVASTTSEIVRQTTGENVIVGATFPASFLKAGTVIRFDAWGLETGGGVAANYTFRIREGASSLSGTVVISVVIGNIAGASNNSWRIEAMFTVRTAGASGTCVGAIQLDDANEVGGAAFNTNSVVRQQVGSATAAIDTTASCVVELTSQCANGTPAFKIEQAVMSVVHMP